jgi:hypothetical protein
MAIRIRCTDCEKKISVDDAFAGGACRCPYCKAIVLVGGLPAEPAGARPYAPVDRPERPDEPPRDEEISKPAEVREVPMANPVHVQGILTVVLLALIVVMVAAAVWLGVVLSRSRGDESNQPAGPRTGVAPPAGSAQSAPAGANPIVPAPDGGPSVAGVTIAAPVFYVLDGGGSMKDVFDYARYMARLSVRSLGPKQTFTLALGTEEGPRFLPASGAQGAGATEGGYRPGGGDGELAVKAFLASSPQGSADVGKAIEAALARRPKTIVLFRKNALEGAKELAQKAKSAGVVIVAVGLGSDAEAQESLSSLADPTGGRCEVFSEEALSSWVAQAPPLE